MNTPNATYRIIGLWRVCTDTCRTEVGGKKRNAESKALGVVRVKVREVGKVNGRAVVHGLECTAGVKVTNSLDLVLLLSARTLAGIDSGGESTRVSQVVSGETTHELQCPSVSCNI